MTGDAPRLIVSPPPAPTPAPSTHGANVIPFCGCGGAYGGATGGGGHWAIEALAPPAVEPLTLEAAKLVLKIDDTIQDALIAGHVVAAREQVERETGRWVARRSVAVWFDGVPASGVLVFPRAPVASVTSVTTYDAAQTPTVVDPGAYQLDASDPPRLVFPAGLPTPSRALAAIRLEVVAAADPAPAWASQACALLLEIWRVPKTDPEIVAAYHAIIDAHYIPGVA